MPRGAKPNATIQAPRTGFKVVWKHAEKGSEMGGIPEPYGCISHVLSAGSQPCRSQWGASIRVTSWPPRASANGSGFPFSRSLSLLLITLHSNPTLLCFSLLPWLLLADLHLPVVTTSLEDVLTAPRRRGRRRRRRGRRMCWRTSVWVERSTWASVKDESQHIFFMFIKTA